MMLNPDDMLIDAHVHVVPPGLPGLHGFPAVLDGAVATVAATVRADMAVSGTAQALAMGVLSDDPDDPLGVAATLRIADQVPGLHAIGVADPRRNEPEPLDRVEHQLRQGRIKGLKAYLGYLPHGPASPGYAPYYRLAARSQIPVIFHSGDTYAASAKLQYAHPLLIDEVAVDYPDTHFVIAHCGCPWFVDAAEVIYKNANVWADRSGLFVGDAAAFAALAARGRWHRTVERLREALEYTERPDRFLYGSDWPLAPMAAYREFLAPRCWTIPRGGGSGLPTPARCFGGEGAPGMNPLPDGYTLQSVAASACPHAEARQAAAIAEACFQSARDPTQMPIDDATVAWLLDTVPAYWNLIKYQGAVIGSTLILPTSRVLMQRFLCAELTEAELWAALRQTPIRSAECGYLAGAALRAPHRRRGLALASLQVSLDYFLAHDYPRPDVYCWVYSEDGRRFLPALRRRLATRGWVLRERQSVAATG